MDNLFKTRVLTTAVNEMLSPEKRVYTRFFAGKEHMEPTDRLAFDIITGSEKLLGNISVAAPATVTPKTGRTTVTMEALRLAQKRFVSTADLNAVRAFGGMAQELMEMRIGREQMDMKNMIDRTLEFWAVNALKGILYDIDGSTQLVNYNLSGTHAITLTSTDLWTDTDNSTPLANLRAWMKLIEDDAGTNITGFHAYCGYEVMDALLAHPDIIDLLKYTVGNQIAEAGRITRLAGIEIEEYNGSYLTEAGVRTRFISSDQILLIGMCPDLTDCPYAPVVDDEAPGGVGNNAGGGGVMYFSKSWQEKDPSGRWIKVETRPLPVLQRPGAIVKATVV